MLEKLSDFDVALVFLLVLTAHNVHPCVHIPSQEFANFGVLRSQRVEEVEICYSLVRQLFLQILLHVDHFDLPDSVVLEQKYHAGSFVFESLAVSGVGYFREFFAK